MGSAHCKQVQSWFLGLERIGNQGRDHVDDAVDGTAVPSMLNLTDVFQLIVHTLNERSLAEQDLVEQRHHLVFHVALELGNQLQTLRPSLLEQLSADVAAIAKEFAPQVAD